MSERLAPLLVLVLALGAGCSGDVPGEKTVSREDYGDQWPFTVDEGKLACTEVFESPFGPVITFEADEPMGLVALNGAALEEGAPDIPKRFWRWDEVDVQTFADATNQTVQQAKKEMDRDGLGGRVSIGGLMDDAFALCDEL